MYLKDIIRVGGKSMLFLRILIVAFIVTGIMDLLAKKSRKKTGALKKFVVRAPLDFAGLGTIVMIIGILTPYYGGSIKCIT